MGCGAAHLGERSKSEGNMTKTYATRLVLLALLAMVGYAVPSASDVRVDGCAQSQSACDECCAEAECCCEQTGGTKTSECFWDDSIPGQLSCSKPGCFAGEQQCGPEPCIDG